ncbi:MAG: hypothetical protein NTX71_01305 [Candidatus Aureabacteria bacterium]|nr:hypothetical protein [Candidatus Auribacterota bacterium]
MSGKSLLGFLAIIAWMIASGCGMFKKEVYMVPTPQGWVEQETKNGGDKIKYKPAERVKVKYE